MASAKQARHLLVTAAVLGPAFRLEDAAEMLGETPAMLLPAVEEAMDAAIMTAAEHAFAFRHPLLRRAVGEMIPRPARKALHRQYGEMLLARGESAARAASHLLQAAHPGDPASLAGLDKAAAQTLRSAPQTAADLALRALELTPPADPGALSRAVAAAEALTAAGRLDQAARIADDMLAKPLPPAAEDRLRCALSSVLCARGQAREAADQAQLVLARPQLPGDLRDQALTAHLQALAGLRDDLAGPVADTILAAPASTTATPPRRPCSPARSSPGTAARSATGSSCCAMRRGTAPGSLPMPAMSSRCSRSPPPWSTCASSARRRTSSAPRTIRRCRASRPRRRCPCCAPASTWPPAGWPTPPPTAQAALAIARTLGAHGYAATAHGVLAVIELRRGDIAAAAQHLACRPATSPQFADLYARAETTAGRGADHRGARRAGRRPRPPPPALRRPGGPARAPARRPRAGRLAGSHRPGRGRRRAGRPRRPRRPGPRRRPPRVPGPGRRRGPQPGPRLPRPGPPGPGRRAAPRSRGPGPPPPKTSASCTAARATGIRPSVT